MKNIKQLFILICISFYMQTSVYATEIMDELNTTQDKLNKEITQENFDVTKDLIPKDDTPSITTQIENDSTSNIETTTSPYLKDRENVIKELILINSKVATLNTLEEEIYLYERPRETSNKSATTNTKHLVEIIGKDKTDSWYFVCFNNNHYGYVKKEYVSTSTTYENIYNIINKNGNVYLELEQYKDFFTQHKKEIFSIYENSNDIDLIFNITTNYLTDETKMILDEDMENLKNDLVDYACQFVGNPYVLGGTSLTEGADCSGFVMRVYSDFGITFSRSLYHQYETGLSVSVDEVEKGDLIFYGHEKLEHVAMYIGDGKVVHASTPQGGIKISNLKMMPILNCQRIVF